MLLRSDWAWSCISTLYSHAMPRWMHPLHGFLSSHLILAAAQYLQAWLTRREWTMWFLFRRTSSRSSEWQLWCLFKRSLSTNNGTWLDAVRKPRLGERTTHGRPYALLHVGHLNGRSCRSGVLVSGHGVGTNHERGYSEDKRRHIRDRTCRARWSTLVYVRWQTVH